MRLPLALVLVGFVGCGGASNEPPAPRDVVIQTEVAADGLSPELSFEIPPGSRSITVVIEGDPGGLYALGGFGVGDGLELVNLPAGAPGDAMQLSYVQEQIGQMPGDLFQSIRLGTYTHVYPYKPGQVVREGGGHLRVASDRPGPVTVRLVMPEDDAANTLPLNIYVVSATLADPNTATFKGELDRLFAQANVSVTINGVERITDSALSRITDFTEPQESPTSQAAMLPGLVADRATTGLDIFFVESLPSGVGGLALGTPGPPIRGAYYFGVVVRGGLPPQELARITAHEAGHFMALQHVENRGVSGRTYPDPLDDTTPGVDNLMEGGTALTAGQTFALSRSALLVTQP